MSNLSDSREKNNSEQNNCTYSKAKRWTYIQTDLTHALNAWEELEKAEITLSPEEEQLVKIKSMISQLREKLEQF